MFKLLIMLLVTTNAYSKSCVISSTQEEVKETRLISRDVPSHLKGAKIIVKLADGRESTVSAEDFKVVPRKQERIITKVETQSSLVCHETLNVTSKNRVSVLAGNGARAGLDRNGITNGTEVKSRTGFVGGLQYQRLLNEKISIGAQGQTNETGSLMIGLDF